jgi:predicted ester cyclase
LRSRMGTYDIKGKPISWDAIVIFQLKNGKIAEEWVSRDELGALLTAGILKPN